MRARFRIAFLSLILAACTAEPNNDSPADDTGGGADQDLWEDTAPQDTGAGDSDSETDADDSLDSATGDSGDAGEEPDIDFTRDPNCAADWLVLATGDLLNDEGEPVDGATAQLCIRLGSADGLLVCLRPTPVNSAGRYEVLVPESARCMGELTMHASNWGGTQAGIFCGLELAAEDGRAHFDPPMLLFETDAATALPPWGDPSQPRNVGFEGGLELLNLRPSELGFLFGEDEYANLGARRIDPASPGLCFMNPGVDELWAFREEVDFAGEIDFRLPNTHGATAGDQVELFVLGGLESTLANGAAIREGEWRQYGMAVVSDDGAWIEGAVPAMTWLGLRF